MDYVIGDVQACLSELQALLEKIQFKPEQDRLFFCGDLVGRGPDALGVLRLLMGLPCAHSVLGNHDIFLLMLLLDTDIPEAVPDDLRAVVDVEDREPIIRWLLDQPLCRTIDDRCVLVHAGIPPQWSLDDALSMNALWQHHLAAADKVGDFLRPLWGNHATWDPEASLSLRLSYVVNAFSRMRFCDRDGSLDFKHKRKHCDLPGYKAWFDWREGDALPIMFGHWAALDGLRGPNVMALDTGCVWGGSLTAYRLDDGAFFQVPLLT